MITAGGLQDIDRNFIFLLDCYSMWKMIKIPRGKWLDFTTGKFEKIMSGNWAKDSKIIDSVAIRFWYYTPS